MHGAIKKRGEHNRSWGARLIVLVPYLWLATFFLLPFLIVVKISFSHTAIAQPPYTPVFDPAAGWEGLKQALSALSFENYALLASDWLYLASYLKSLEVAAGSTLLLLLVGFPLAYGMARTPRRAGVPFFFKQWGGIRKGKMGRELDGETYDGFPFQLDIARETG